jgi:undecaprenyl-diphosphatase
MRDGILIGFAQALALIPGVSRSGATDVRGAAPGLRPRRRRALLLPAVRARRGPLRALPARDIGGEGARPRCPTAIATVLAFVSGYASIAFLLKFLVTHTFDVFVIYRIGLGVLVLALAASGAIA